MKLSAWVIYLCGLLFGLAILSYFAFWHYLPNQRATGYWNTQKELLEAEANKQGAATRKLEEAKRMVDEKDQAWQRIVATRTPPPNLPQGINLATNPYQLTVDAPKFRNSVQRAINARLQTGGVRLVGNGPVVPETGDDGAQILSDFFNFPAISFPVVILDLGTITVQGTYEQIKNHVRSWANMPNYLAVADGLQLQGTSPVLTGTYNLSIVGFIRGRDIFPAIPTGAPAAAGGAAPGGARGPVPGMPGGQAPPMGSMPGMPAGTAGPGGTRGGR